MSIYIKGRGSQINPANRFAKNNTDIYLDDLATEEEREQLLTQNARTKYIEVFPKTLVNKVDSPDVGPAWNMNPYQGCEHGCIYCYARNSHEYWGYDAGLGFEQNILVKKKAPELLRKHLLSKKWQPQYILISGNTDCYQPAERKFQITRELLGIFYEFRHPVSVITKNSLIERDIDILTALAGENLVYVTMSLTTLDEKLKRIMEPRTSSALGVLRSVKRLSDAGIPVNINVAPVRPGINDEGTFELIKQVAEAGALSAGYIIVRLNGHNAVLFEDWVNKNFPDRAQKVLSQIKSMHGGTLNDNQFGRRMKGEGKFAELIRNQFSLAKRKFMAERTMPPLNFNLFEGARREVINQAKGQLNLF